MSLSTFASTAGLYRVGTVVHRAALHYYGRMRRHRSPENPVVHALLAAFAALVLLGGCASDPRIREIAAEYYNIGNAFFELGRYEKAIDAYRSALRFDPRLAKADFNLALTFARMKMLPEAEQVLKKLLADDPANASLMVTLAWAYHLAGKDAEALSQYDAALAIAPENADAWYNSALILWKLERRQEALERFQRLLAVAPDDSEGLFGAGSLLLSMDDPAAAEEYLGRCVQKKPEDLDARYLLADSLERQRKLSRVLEEYDRILERDARQANAWFGKARLLLTAIEDPDNGMVALRKSLELGFRDGEAAGLLLASPGLLEREAVEAALKERGLPPAADAVSAAVDPAAPAAPAASPP
jgi:tetratricopeptide (TPR) repeat protein